MNELAQRIEQGRQQVAELDGRAAWAAKRDLRRMLGVVDSIMTELSKESVNCRRSQKETRRYQELHQQALAALNNFEQHLLLARLRF